MSVRINNVLEYQGAALPIFSLAPSWRASPGFSARAEAETVVSESLSGAEYRAQRRPRPFWRLRFEAISHDARESGYARRVVQLGADLPVAVPYWPHRVDLPAAAAGEATSISHEDTGDTIWPDARYALIWVDALNWEVVEIDGEAGATVTNLAEALEESWPAGASLVPLLVGHLERGAGATHETDELGVWLVDFRESPVEALGVTEVGEPPVQPVAVWDASEHSTVLNTSGEPAGDDEQVDELLNFGGSYGEDADLKYAPSTNSVRPRRYGEVINGLDVVRCRPNSESAECALQYTPPEGKRVELANHTIIFVFRLLKIPGSTEVDWILGLGSSHSSADEPNINFFLWGNNGTFRYRLIEPGGDVREISVDLPALESVHVWAGRCIDGNMVLYRDGVLVGTNDGNWSVNHGVLSALGARNNPGASYSGRMKGDIGHVKIWDEGLSNTLLNQEIAAMMQKWGVEP